MHQKVFALDRGQIFSAKDREKCLPQGLLWANSEKKSLKINLFLSQGVEHITAHFADAPLSRANGL
jgi:hypothetical protein